MIARCLIAALAAVVCTCAMVQRVADAQVADAAMGAALAKIGSKTVGEVLDATNQEVSNMAGTQPIFELNDRC